MPRRVSLQYPEKTVESLHRTMVQLMQAVEQLQATTTPEETSSTGEFTFERHAATKHSVGQITDFDDAVTAIVEALLPTEEGWEFVQTLYDGTATVANVVTPNFLPGYEYRAVFRNVQFDAGVPIVVEMHVDGAYYSDDFMGVSAVGEDASALFNGYVNFPTAGTETDLHVALGDIDVSTATVSPAATYAVNAASPQLLARARFSGSIDGGLFTPVTGNFVGGLITLYRRST